MNSIERNVLAKVRMVASDATYFGVLSTSERIAVALVLDRYDLLHGCWGTMLEAIDRLGPEWSRAALHIQRNAWTRSPQDSSAAPRSNSDREL
jgi:hypothetical protein